ncbi:MAG: hypothetical protein ABIQ36_10405, partial [Rhodanobacter sp.]
KAQKNPASVTECGVLWVFSGFSHLPGHMPSARTSVGNKEYEYKDKKERAASLQGPGNRQKTVCFGGASVAVALRHGSTVSDACIGCQQKSYDEIF